MKLKDIETTLRQATGSEAVFTLLAELLEIAKGTLGDPRFSAERLNQLAGYLAEIRHLLETIGNDRVTPAVSRASKIMAARYRDIEGRVKELRNDRMAGI